MKQTPTWQFDEFQQIGRDYTSVEEVRIYDQTHAQFRDIAQEANQALDRLGVSPNQVLLDIGSGTGVFAMEAARRGLKVHAADVSETMIAYARERTSEVDITFHHAGFLTVDLPEESVDAITTTYAFHHLPDFWKGIALKRMATMLKPGGQLYLRDVILQESQALQNIQNLIDHQEKLGGDFLREDAEGHFRDEHSTYDWVMEELFKRAGLNITDQSDQGGVLGVYYCRKP